MIQDAINNTVGIKKLCGKTVLIMGATGLIGSYITRMLISLNESLEVTGPIPVTIIAASRKIENLENRFGKNVPNLFFVSNDMVDAYAGTTGSMAGKEPYACSADGLEEKRACAYSSVELENVATFLAKIDYIIHAASPSHPAAFRENPVEVMKANIGGVTVACELARSNKGCRVLYLSSGEAMHELDHLNTRACYPISKKASETLCLSYAAEYGVDVRIARICHTFGGDVIQADNKASSQFIRMAAKGEDIVLLSKGEQRRSYAYVYDVASAILTILCADLCSGVIYNIASDDSCSIYEFAAMCADEGGV
ncbi:MAG: NAD-dependent epimerase/dehydratase family protein, partial [Lachnospiraceae bacterium]|nr:NAD-dependent epimerase/dehydratase family protein [Candidatus Merdinaster equi]